jgi:predicted metal-dependent hydrolase
MLQLSFNFLARHLRRRETVRVPDAGGEQLLAWKHGITVRIVRRPRARRYLLSLPADGCARLVIPRRGTQAEGLRFLERSEAWLLRRAAQWRERHAARQAWQDSARFLFRGEEVNLRVEADGAGARLSFAGEVISLPRVLGDYREPVKAHLQQMAEQELPARTHELARQHGIAIRRVSVRAQKTRWGSCSMRGTISLNWRLVQAPAFVVDYLIVHELMHRREMNHSARYWRQVAQAFPEYRAAEKWLKKSGLDLREF